MIRYGLRIAGLGLFGIVVTPLLFGQRGRGGGGIQQLPQPAELIVQGSVVLPGGTVSLRLVRVEELCGGRSVAAGFPDSKGRFGFDLGFVDTGPGGSGPAAVPFASTAASASSKKDCSIRASLAGYHPQTIALEHAVRNAKTNLGELQLQPLGKQPGAAVSATDADVPVNARKDYDKGVDAAAKAKWKDAIAAIQKAASSDKKFATAWLTLGMLQFSQNDTESALRSYAQAMEADDRFVPAFLEAAAIESSSGRWPQVIEHTSKVIALDPDAFAGAYYLNAMANIRLGQTDAARKSVAEGLRVDTDHEYPDLEYMDGILLANSGDRDGARKRFEEYLKLAPDGSNADNARQLLSGLPQQK